MADLIECGLMPKNELARKSLEHLDPYELRARGLDEQLTPYEFGRALFHLHQRRGFNSNRRVNGSASAEAGKIRGGSNRLLEMMEECSARTLGEFLYQRRQKGESVRTRLNGSGTRAFYDFFAERNSVKEEFDKLWQSQSRWQKDLTENLRTRIEGTIFRQRPLRPFNPGKCSLDPAKNPADDDGFRAHRALPIAQRFRILSDLANLRITGVDQVERKLSDEQHDTLRQALYRGRRISLKAIRTMLSLSDKVVLNLDSDFRDHLAGDATAALMAKPGCFGSRWSDLSLSQQSRIIERLLSDTDESELLDWLKGCWGLDDAASAAVARAPLADGHVRLGRRALKAIVEIMERDRVDYAEACSRAGYRHSDKKPSKVLEKLPYYGAAIPNIVCGSGDPADDEAVRYGRLPNPSVHIGLNQLRLLVNSLIDAGQRPSEIVIEVARELKLNAVEKRQLATKQLENRRKNTARLEILKSLGLPDNGENRLRLRLWEELNVGDTAERYCVYSGQKIGLDILFTSAVEVEHILPFSRTLDNSVANKTVCLRSMNRIKGECSPFEAFGHRSGEWAGIMARAERFPRNKKWRFDPDAMERWKHKGGFLQRHLNDTAYLSRLTREYMTHVCPEENVWVVPGRLTSMLRGVWGLNSLLSDNNLKNRSDHRHHAIDAVVIALTDRTLLGHLSRISDGTRYRHSSMLPEPWPDFRDELRSEVSKIVVSVKPDHGKRGPLHQETAYGLVKEPEKENGYNLVYRKPLIGLSDSEVARVRDASLRQTLMEKVKQARAKGENPRNALMAFSAKSGIRRVRLMRKESEVVVVGDKNAETAKAFVPGDNHHVDVFRKGDGAWDGEGVTVFQANRPDYKAEWQSRFPAAELLMRVHKGDMIRLDMKDGEQVARVVRLEIKAKRLRLVPHYEGGELQKRHDDQDDPFRWSFASYEQLRKRRGRKVSVDILGRVLDRGPFPDEIH
jgi:CRISPR-associated endonuclease Csn1